MIDILILFTFLAWFLLVIALWKDNKLLGFLAGIMILVLGMFSLIYGVQEVNTNLTRMYGVINIGIGIFLILTAGIEIMQDAEH